MSKLKDKIVRWAIKQIVLDGSTSYGGMRYLEDVMTNDFGESMYIFSHKLVPLDKAKMLVANAKRPTNSVAFADMSDDEE